MLGLYFAGKPTQIVEVVSEVLKEELEVHGG